jgi:hypothetical protein
MNISDISSNEFVLNNFDLKQNFQHLMLLKQLENEIYLDNVHV